MEMVEIQKLNPGWVNGIWLDMYAESFFLYECFQIIVVFILYFCACEAYGPLEFYLTCVFDLM